MISTTFSATFEQNPAGKTTEQRDAILADPGFGNHFTDHMFTVEWTPAEGWHDARITPYGPITLDPAAAVLHYAQEIFEGMKAYRHDDGSVWLFRPEANAERMMRSTERLVDAVDRPIVHDEALGVLASLTGATLVTESCLLTDPGALLSVSDEARGAWIKVAIGLVILGLVLAYSIRRLRSRRIELRRAGTG